MRNTPKKSRTMTVKNSEAQATCFSLTLIIVIPLMNLEVFSAMELFKTTIIAFISLLVNYIIAALIYDGSKARIFTAYLVVFSLSAAIPFLGNEAKTAWVYSLVAGVLLYWLSVTYRWLRRTFNI